MIVEVENKGRDSIHGACVEQETQTRGKQQAAGIVNLAATQAWC